MYRTNSTPPLLTPASRYALALLAICLLVSAAPFTAFDSDGPCELCDQDDDIAAGPALSCLGAAALLIERPGCPCVTPPATLASRFPHPPTF